MGRAPFPIAVGLHIQQLGSYMLKFSIYARKGKRQPCTEIATLRPFYYCILFKYTHLRKIEFYAQNRISKTNFMEV